MPGWMKRKLESRLLGEISITSDMQMTQPYDRKQSGTKEPLDEGERGECKSWLKTKRSKSKDEGIQSHHSMANKCGNPLEKEMATHSSILAWKIPWTEERGRPQSLGWQRVSHDWTHQHKWGNNGNSDRLYFLGLQNHCGWWLQPWN